MTKNMDLESNPLYVKAEQFVWENYPYARGEEFDRLVLAYLTGASNGEKKSEDQKGETVEGAAWLYRQQYNMMPKDYPTYSAEKGFLAGAEWQRKKWQERFYAIEKAVLERPVHEDVNSELKEFVLNSTEYALSDDRLLMLAEHFVEWERNRLLKGSVDGEVCILPGAFAYVKEENNDKLKQYLIDNCKTGDQVKIVIVKK